MVWVVAMTIRIEVVCRMGRDIRRCQHNHAVAKLTGQTLRISEAETDAADSTPNRHAFSLRHPREPIRQLRVGGFPGINHIGVAKGDKASRLDDFAARAGRSSQPHENALSKQFGIPA